MTRLKLSERSILFWLGFGWIVASVIKGFWWTYTGYVPTLQEELDQGIMNILSIIVFLVEGAREDILHAIKQLKEDNND